jgi:FtsH-binding integral membrane protein
VALVLEPIPVTNLIFSALIVIIGLLVYGRTKKDSPLDVAGVFLFFGLSHLAAILGIAEGLATPLLVLWIIGYVLIVGVLYLWYTRRGVKKG